MPKTTVFRRLLTAYLKQGTDNRNRRVAGLPTAEQTQTAQTGGTATTNKVHQHRLGMIVTGMAGGHPLSANGVYDLRQKPVAGLAGGFFERKPVLPPVVGDIASLNRGRDTESLCQASHVPCCGGGFGATQAVIEVRHVQSNAKFIADVMEDVQ